MCDHCHSLADFALSGRGRTCAETVEEGFTYLCLWCWNMDCLTAEIASLTGIVKEVEIKMTKETDGIESDDRERRRKEQSDKKDEERRLRGGRAIAWDTNGERT